MPLGNDEVQRVRSHLCTKCLAPSEKVLMPCKGVPTFLSAVGWAGMIVQLTLAFFMTPVSA